MKFVAISDTHGKHHELTLPSGDVLIHAGDLTKRGKEAEVKDFLNWFAAQDFKHKILIAGNHDFYFEKNSQEAIKNLIPESVIYLCDGGITINNVKIWGSPVTPWFHDWAFNRQRGEEILHHWNLMPMEIDILITHGPAFGILDSTSSNQQVGCKELLTKIQNISPKYFICGHIHEAYGQQISGSTTFINASVLDEKYRLRNLPIVFEL